MKYFYLTQPTLKQNVNQLNLLTHAHIVQYALNELIICEPSTFMIYFNLYRVNLTLFQTSIGNNFFTFISIAPRLRINLKILYKFYKKKCFRLFCYYIFIAIALSLSLPLVVRTLFNKIYFKSWIDTEKLFNFSISSFIKIIKRSQVNRRQNIYQFSLSILFCVWFYMCVRACVYAWDDTGKRAAVSEFMVS